MAHWPAQQMLTKIKTPGIVL